MDSKWVFKTKRDANGNIQKYKARLVIKGCAQKSGIDFTDTYAPVVRYSSIRFLISLACKLNLDIDQMDAVTAFLQGDLNEEIYMIQPKYFNKGMKVCKLNKSIYGLKQASRIWNIKLDNVLKSLGLKQSNADPCIYFNLEGNKILIIAVYVDDLLIFTNNQPMKLKLKSNLKKKFKMKDMGQARFCLGLQITRDRKRGKIWLDQRQYIGEILEKST